MPGRELAPRSRRRAKAPILASVGRLIGDHLHRAGDHQPAGGAEKATDDGKGYKTNGASRMRESEDAQAASRSAPWSAKGDRGSAQAGRCRLRQDAGRRVATIAAKTTEMELSGPATAKDSELRNATIIRRWRPKEMSPQRRRTSECSSGPEKISAA